MSIELWECLINAFAEPNAFFFFFLIELVQINVLVA